MLFNPLTAHPGRKEKRMKQDFDTQLKRNITTIKNRIKDLQKMGLKIECQQVENMMGSIVNNIYVTDYVGERVCLQKHLFTVYE